MAASPGRRRSLIRIEVIGYLDTSVRGAPAEMLVADARRDSLAGLDPELARALLQGIEPSANLDTLLALRCRILDALTQ